LNNNFESIWIRRAVPEQVHAAFDHAQQLRGVKAMALVLGQVVTQCIVQVVLVPNGLVPLD